MKKNSPSYNMFLLEMALAAWREFAPEMRFGGKSLAELEAAITASQTDRTNITNADNEMKALLITRDDHDLIALAIRTLLVNGVVGDANFGPNSAFYEALGYIRKDNRKSGLTRKKKEAVKDGN